MSTGPVEGLDEEVGTMRSTWVSRQARPWWRLSLSVTSAAAIALAVSACGGDGAQGGGGGSPASGAAGQPFTVAIPSDPDDLDPAGVYTEIADQVWRNAYSGMLTYATEPSPTVDGSFELVRSEIVPSLAEKYSVSDDGKVITFTLRQGLRWPTGDPVTADDALYSYERAVKIESTGAFFFDQAGITDVNKQFEKLSDYELRLTLREPNNLTLPILALGVTSWVNSKLVKSKATDSDPWGNEFARTSYAGYGPYEVTSYVPGTAIEMVPNPDWFGDKPEAPLTMQVVPSEATRLLLVQRGSVSVAQGISALAAKRVESDENVRVVPFKTGLLTYLAMNNNVKPFNDPRVRRAMAYGLDADATIQQGWAGLADPATSPIATGYQGHIDAWPYSYDPERAKQLLQEAGHADGFSTGLIYPNSPANQAASVAIKSQLEDIGVRLEVKGMPDGQYSTAVYGKQDFSSSLHSCWTFIDDRYYSANLQMGTEGICGLTYSDPQVDEALADLRAADTEEAAQAAAAAAQERFAANPGYVLIAQPNLVMVTQADVQGLTFIKEDGAFGYERLTRAGGS